MTDLRHLAAVVALAGAGLSSPAWAVCPPLSPYNIQPDGGGCQPASSATVATKVTAAQAAAAAPVQMVAGRTGIVNLTVADVAGAITAAQATAVAPIQAVNGKTGNVTLSVSDIPGAINAAMAASIAPVQTVNGSIGAVSITPSSIGALTPAGDASATTVLGRSLLNRANDIVNLRDYSIGVGIGNATADTAAMRAALAFAVAHPGTNIYMPTGSYTFTVGPTTPLQVPTKTTISGAGGGASFVHWNDDDGNNLFTGLNPGGAREQDVRFERFDVVGTQDTRGNATAYPFLIYAVDGLTFDSLVVEHSRIFSITGRASTDVAARNNIVRYSGRDGINLSECDGVTITDNQLSHIDDDAIAVHSDTQDADGVRRNTVISGNRIFDAQGIKVLSARQATITGNTLDVIKAEGIQVSTTVLNGGAEGQSAALNINISGNTITNLISRAHIDNLNQNAPGIVISGDSARSGTYPAIPGEPAPTTGVIADPYREVLANSTAATVPTPASYGVIVAHNTIMRTLPATNGSDPRFTSWTSLGLGQMFERGGFYNPTLAESDMRDAAVEISGGVVRDVLMTGNIVRGMEDCLAISNGVRFDNLMFTNNQCVDINSFGVLVNTNAKLRLYATDNLFDMDPFHKHANRGPIGTWLAQGGPSALYDQAGTGVYFERNVIRNAGQVANFSTQFPNAGYYFDANIVEADPTALGGFDTRNKGVGMVWDNEGTRLSRADSNPTSPTYGTILAMPSPPTGTLVGRASAGSGPRETITLGPNLALSTAGVLGVTGLASITDARFAAPTITGGSINAAPIGAATPSTIVGTSVSSTGNLAAGNGSFFTGFDAGNGGMSLGVAGGGGTPYIDFHGNGVAANTNSARMISPAAGQWQVSTGTGGLLSVTAVGVYTPGAFTADGGIRATSIGGNGSPSTGLFTTLGASGALTVGGLANFAANVNLLGNISGQTFGNGATFGWNATSGGSGDTMMVLGQGPGSTGGLDIFAANTAGAVSPATPILTLSSAGVLTATAPIKLSSYTVATLPACTAAIANSMAAVTDATAPAYNAALTGGGAVHLPVFCSGTSWTAH